MVSTAGSSPGLRGHRLDGGLPLRAGDLDLRHGSEPSSSCRHGDARARSVGSGCPFFVTFVFPRFGLRLPDWIMTCNAWLTSEQPDGPLVQVTRHLCFTRHGRCSGPDVRSPGRRRRLCLLGAIVQLRPSCRAAAGGDEPGALADSRLRPSTIPGPAAGRRRSDPLEGDVHVPAEGPWPDCWIS